MIATILSWLGGKLAGPLAALAALLFASGLLWQTARIDGVPLLGGGLKADIAALHDQIAARDLAKAKAQAAALQLRAALAAKGEAAARDHAVLQAKTETQIQTIIREVPRYVPASSDSQCVLPWGFVRLFDAAASGADPDDVRAHVAPGFADDAASDVKLSEALALLAANFGAARENASQLEHLEKGVAADGKRP